MKYEGLLFDFQFLLLLFFRRESFAQRDSLGLIAKKWLIDLEAMRLNLPKNTDISAPQREELLVFLSKREVFLDLKKDGSYETNQGFSAELQKGKWYLKDKKIHINKPDFLLIKTLSKKKMVVESSNKPAMDIYFKLAKKK